MSKQKAMRDAIAVAKTKPRVATPPPQPPKVKGPATTPPKPLLPGQKPTKSQRTAKSRDKRHVARGRLPDGSSFVATYNAQEEKWTVKLFVAGLEFRATGGGLFRTIEDLDIQYRESLKGPPATPEPEVVPA